MQKYSKYSGFVNYLKFWKIVILIMILKLTFFYICTGFCFSLFSTLYFSSFAHCHKLTDLNSTNLNCFKTSIIQWLKKRYVYFKFLFILLLLWTSQAKFFFYKFKWKWKEVCIFNNERNVFLSYICTTDNFGKHSKFV